MLQVASTTSSSSPWVVVPQTQPHLLLAQAAPTAQFVSVVPGHKAEAKEEPAAPASATINPMCLCFFALLSALLLMAVAGYWTANFLLSSDMVFSMESYKNSSITWSFNNFQTKIVSSQFVPIGLKLVWWIMLGVAALYGLLAVACHSRCHIILVCLMSLVNTVFFAILAADEGQLWANAETALKNQWKDEISASRFNFRSVGLSRIMYEYQCCGIDNGCSDFGATKDSVWLNSTLGSGCFSSQCSTPCSGKISRVKTVLLFPFTITLVALILTAFLFMSTLCIANQLAKFAQCFTVEPAEGGGGDE